VPVVSADEAFGQTSGRVSADDAFGPPSAQAAPQGRLAGLLERFFPTDPKSGRRTGLFAGVARQLAGLDRPLDEDLSTATELAPGVPGVPKFLSQAVIGELAEAVQNVRKAKEAEGASAVGYGLGAIPFVGTSGVSLAETLARGDVSGAAGEAAVALPIFKLAKAGLGRVAGRAVGSAAAKEAAEAAARQALEEGAQREVIERLLAAEAEEFAIAPRRAAETVFEGNAEAASRVAGITGPETAAREALERPLPRARGPEPSGLEDLLDRQADELVPEERPFQPGDLFHGDQTAVAGPAEVTDEVLPSVAFLDNSIQMRREVPPFTGGQANFVPEGFNPRTGRPVGALAEELTAPPPREGPGFENALQEGVDAPGRPRVTIGGEGPIRLSREDLPDELAGPPEPRLPARETLPGEAGEGLEGLAISQPGRPLPERVLQGEPFSLTEQVGPGEATRLADAIERARGAITQTERLRGQEVGERFRAAEARLAKSPTGAGLEEARAAMSGRMPSAEFAPLDLTPGQVESYRGAIARAPVETSVKLAADDGMKKLVAGEVLQRSEIAAIEKILGPQVGEAAASRTAEHGMGWMTAVLDLPRSLFAGGPELSPWFRQLGVSVAGNPRIGFTSLEKGVRALFGSKGVSREVVEEFYKDLASRANSKLYDQSGLKFVEVPTAARALEGLSEGVAINPIIDAVPGLRNVYRRSARASAVMINAQRADVFDAMAAPFLREGKNAKSDPALFKAIGQWVNVTTGRGSFGRGERFVPLLSQVLFSPRYAAARLQLPTAFLALKKQSPELARKAAGDLFAWFSSRAAILGSVKIAKELRVPGFEDAQIDDNPLSSDFGKARFGKTRLDVWGGNLQYARALYRISQAAVGNPTREKLTGDQVSETIFNILQQVAASQANPGARLVTQFADTPGGPFQGVVKDAFGREVPLKEVLADNFVSGIVDGTREIIQKEPKSVWLIPFLALGAGTQVYDEPAQLTEQERGQLRRTEEIGKKNTELRRELEPKLEKEQKAPAERLAGAQRTNTRLEGVRTIITLLQAGDKAGARREAARIRRETKGRVNIDIRALEAALTEEVQP
jgi:hypothetical protein